MQVRSQSAAEYLMTYGWAIVAIGVAIGVLYSLGVFPLGSNAGTGCIVVEGFSCSKPVLYSSGALSVGLAQIGSSKTITAIGCSSNSTEPINWQSTSITLQSGQVSNFTFICPNAQNAKVGSLYQNTLWVQYATSGQSSPTSVQVAVVKLVVQPAYSIPGVPAGSYYVNMTVNNQQSVSAPNGFQQNILVPSTYSQYEASDLGNIRFYSSSNSTLYSWCESGCLKGSIGSFWVYLPSGIAANGNVLVHLVFEPTSVEYDGVYAGESPLSSNSYAKYDDGASVFNALYQNFAGGSCPGGWACSAGTNVNNGITPSYVADPSSLQISGQMLEAYSGYSGLPMTSNVFPVTFGYNYTNPVCTLVGGHPVCTLPTASQFGFTLNSVCSNYACPYISAMQTIPSFALIGTPTYDSAQQVQNGNGILSVYYNSTSGDISYQRNYGTVYNIVPNSGYEIPTGALFGVSIASPPGASISVNWVRERDYPPNGAMPTYTFGPTVN